MTSSTAVTSSIVVGVCPIYLQRFGRSRRTETLDLESCMYADQTAFDADLAAWEVERAARAELVKQGAVLE